MQSMKRQVGKLRNKGPGDNAKVSVLLNDYEDADKVLVKVIPPLLRCPNSGLRPPVQGRMADSCFATTARSLMAPSHGASLGCRLCSHS